MAARYPKSETIFDSVQIQEVLPHRYPFLLIDRIVEYEESRRIVGLKNVSINEHFFQGHFPENPVMPGVLLIEAMAQASAVLAKKSHDGVPEDKLIYLVGAEDFRFKKQVVPGDTLIIDMTLAKRKAPLWKMNGLVTVDGELVAKGVIIAAEER